MAVSKFFTHSSSTPFSRETDLREEGSVHLGRQKAREEEAHCSLIKGVERAEGPPSRRALMVHVNSCRVTFRSWGLTPGTS